MLSPEITTSQWIAHLRHDMSNGVNGIIGYSELILEELEELELQDLENQEKWINKIQQINQCGSQILSLIKIYISAKKVDSFHSEEEVEEVLKTLRLDLESPIQLIFRNCYGIRPIIEPEFVEDVKKIEKAVNTLYTITQQLDRVETIKNYILQKHSQKAITPPQSAPTSLSIIDYPLISEREFLEISQGRILVVDDNQNNRELLSRQIEEQGYIVSAVSNGEEAITKIQTGEYDLIFLDVIMPEIDGYQVLQWLHQSPWHYIPVIMISALDELDSIVKCLEMGAEDYLHKPFNPVLLKARIKPCLEKKKLRDRDLEKLSQAYSELEKKNSLLRKVFGRYLSEEIVSSLLDNPSLLNLGGERKKLTILTSDLRGFTAMSEGLSPEQVLKILNFYLKHMAEIITRYQGTIDKFIGDGILVLFGAPTDREDDPSRAVACAIEMQLAMTAVNEQMKAWNLPFLEMGIGINTGEVVVGNIGSEKRTDYSAVGSHVNLTYRIESFTIGGQILISEATYHEVRSLLEVKGKKQIQSKGVKEPITIYDIIGIRGHYNCFLPQTKEEFFPLTYSIPVRYSLLDGKEVSPHIIEGFLTHLSHQGAVIQPGIIADQILPPELVNLKLNLLDESEQSYSEDIYGKVTGYPQAEFGFYLHFSFKPSDINQRLQTLYKMIQKLQS